ncbi:MAG: hypothetical protein CR988_06935 [Treponema sp.]|nr:MAG: hypothetical protein CR988_06935 [Treponema sp.]
MANQKKRILELPLKLILTQEGSTFFIRQRKKLIKFKLAGDVEEYGIFLDKFQPSTLQRLLLAGFVSKIEISKSEFVSSRQEIMDLSKLIVYSVLYRQYDSFIFNEFINSPVIKKWNRLNPANIIDEKTHINEKILTQALSKNQNMIYQTKQQILGPLSSFILKNSQLSPEEKNVQLFLSEKFLNNLRPFTWFLLPKIKESPDADNILKVIRTGLVEYMDKTKIAEYVSLMLMELILSAENMNLRNEAKNLFPELTNSQDALFDPTIRRRLVAELEKKQELVFVSWKLGGSSSASIGTQGKLQITLYSKNEKSEAVRENLNDVKNTDVDKNSLIDFYKDMPEGSQDSSLGMYYISYLSDACEQVNVRFESGANKFQNSDLAVINMSFMF